jgi:hypothetical protein
MFQPIGLGSSPTVREGFVSFAGRCVAGTKPSLMVGLLPRGLSMNIPSLQDWAERDLKGLEL